MNDQTAEEMFVHCDIAGPLSRYANVQHVCRRTPAPEDKSVDRLPLPLSLSLDVGENDARIRSRQR